MLALRQCLPALNLDLQLLDLAVLILYVCVPTRKPSAKEARDPSAAMMRGAGSIHAAADLVMTINKDPREATKVRVSFSARSARPPEGYFQIEPNTQTHAWIPSDVSKNSEEKSDPDTRKRNGYTKILKSRATTQWQEVKIEWIEGKIVKEFKLPVSEAPVKKHLSNLNKETLAGLGLEIRKEDTKSSSADGLGIWVRKVDGAPP